MPRNDGLLFSFSEKLRLIQLLRWIASDGQLRTDDEIIDEIVPVLGFSRRGVRIENAIRNALALWRSQS
jgi:hypothetical protein